MLARDGLRNPGAQEREGATSFTAVQQLSPSPSDWMAPILQRVTLKTLSSDPGSPDALHAQRPTPPPPSARRVLSCRAPPRETSSEAAAGWHAENPLPFCACRT